MITYLWVYIHIYWQVIPYSEVLNGSFKELLEANVKDPWLLSWLNALAFSISGLPAAETGEWIYIFLYMTVCICIYVYTCIYLHIYIYIPNEYVDATQQYVLWLSVRTTNTYIYVYIYLYIYIYICMYDSYMYIYM
jgi:hypothetical protein